VSDTGRGIPPERIAELKRFEKWVAVSGSNDHRNAGSGLGLFICNSLVRLMNGHLEIESTVGVGTTFTAYVQVHHAAMPDMQFPPHLIDALTRINPRVAIVLDEDDQTQCGLNKHMECLADYLADLHFKDITMYRVPEEGLSPYNCPDILCISEALWLLISERSREKLVQSGVFVFHVLEQSRRLRTFSSSEKGSERRYSIGGRERVVGWAISVPLRREELFHGIAEFLRERQSDSEFRANKLQKSGSMTMGSGFTPISNGLDAATPQSAGPGPSSATSASPSSGGPFATDGTTPSPIELIVEPAQTSNPPSAPVSPASGAFSNNSSTTARHSYWADCLSMVTEFPRRVVLFAEDNPVSRNITMRMLDAGHMVCVETANGWETIVEASERACRTIHVLYAIGVMSFRHALEAEFVIETLLSTQQSKITEPLSGARLPNVLVVHRLQKMAETAQPHDLDTTQAPLLSVSAPVRESLLEEIAFRPFIFDVALMDREMPLMTGPEAALFIRQLAADVVPKIQEALVSHGHGSTPIRRVKMLSFSADPGQPVPENCFDAMLPKPIRKQELLETLTLWMSDSRRSSYPGLLTNVNVSVPGYLVNGNRADANQADVNSSTDGAVSSPRPSQP
jgi:CheY-like chemotaxis protein